MPEGQGTTSVDLDEDAARYDDVMTGMLGGTKERPNALRRWETGRARASRHMGSLSSTATAASADGGGSIDLGEEGVEVLKERLVDGAELSVDAIEEATSPRPLELVADGPLDELLDVPLTRLRLDSLDELWGQLPRRFARFRDVKRTVRSAAGTLHILPFDSRRGSPGHPLADAPEHGLRHRILSILVNPRGGTGGYQPVLDGRPHPT